LAGAEKSDDTPRVNAYLEEVERLSEAEKNGTPVEPVDGAVCKLVEHDDVDLLDAPQVFKAQCVASDLFCSVGVAAQVVDRTGEKPPREPNTSKVGDVIEQPPAFWVPFSI
jgi:hypothetical protein